MSETRFRMYKEAPGLCPAPCVCERDASACIRRRQAFVLAPVECVWGIRGVYRRRANHQASISHFQLVSASIKLVVSYSISYELLTCNNRT